MNDRSHGTSHTPTRLLQAPSWLISQVALVAHRLVMDQFATAGARGYHYRLLSALDEFGPASQAELGRQSGIDRSDVVATVNELVAGGFVERRTDPADRRRNVISITPAGAEQLRRLDQVLGEIQNELVAPLSPQERAQLIGFLRRIRDYHTSA